MNPADLVLDNIRNSPASDFIDAAHEAFACTTLDKFLVSFLVHPQVCADIWNNMALLPGRAQPSELLAALLHLTRRQVRDDGGDQVRWTTPVQRSEEYVLQVATICNFVSRKLVMDLFKCITY